MPTPASPAYGWGVFLGDKNSNCTPGSSGGNTLGGSSGITVDVYIKGSLCVSGNSSPFILQPAGTTDTLTVYIGGQFKSSSNSSPIGTSAAKIHLATVVGGCYDSNHNQSVPCSKQGSPLNNVNSAAYGSGVWATNYSSTQNDIAKPTIDTAWYSNAAPGPGNACGAGSTFPNPGTPWTTTNFKNRVLDNDSTRNTSVGTVQLLELVDRSSGAGGTAHNSFDCKSYDSNGTLIGELKWDYPTRWLRQRSVPNGVSNLTINGTVFIDGNLSLASCDYAVYQGRGTIYVNGTVTFANGAKICAKPISGSPCNGNFDPNSNLLEIVAVNSSNTSPGFALSGAGTLRGRLLRERKSSTPGTARTSTAP